MKPEDALGNLERYQQNEWILLTLVTLVRFQGVPTEVYGARNTPICLKRSQFTFLSNSHSATGDKTLRFEQKPLK